MRGAPGRGCQESHGHRGHVTLRPQPFAKHGVRDRNRVTWPWPQGHRPAPLAQMRWYRRRSSHPFHPTSTAAGRAHAPCRLLGLHLTHTPPAKKPARLQTNASQCKATASPPRAGGGHPLHGKRRNRSRARRGVRATAWPPTWARRLCRATPRRPSSASHAAVECLHGGPPSAKHCRLQPLGPPENPAAPPKLGNSSPPFFFLDTALQWA
jgi:hypothetical protein